MASSIAEPDFAPQNLVPPTYLCGVGGRHSQLLSCSRLNIHFENTKDQAEADRIKNRYLKCGVNSPRRPEKATRYVSKKVNTHRKMAVVINPARIPHKIAPR